jgi:hypothetical protein
VSSVNKSESPEHRKLVKGLIEYLRGIGFETTCAAYEGYPQCEEMERHVPDVMGKNAQGLFAIGEAKTCDDLDNDRTNEQFKVFSNRIMAQGNLKGQIVPFYIRIPKVCVQQLKGNLRKLGLDQKANIYIVTT